MYVPAANTINDETDVREMVETLGSAELVSIGPEGYPVATLLPIFWRGDVVVAHMARANQHWKSLDGVPGLLICGGPQAYISPSWYAAKAEHGRVVPTWNYSAVHLTGTVHVHDDVEWLRDAVTELTERHEQARATPWQVTDAPATFVEGQLRGIVGLELRVEKVEAKAKLSQNRSEADRAGVVTGLRREGVAGADGVAGAMGG